MATNTISEPVGSASDPTTTSFSSLIAEWSYVSEDARDLRVDFLRGVAMFILVVVHIELFSVFNFIVWERFGVVSGAEGFTILSGVVLGSVHHRKIEKSGWRASASGMYDRAFQLYRINVAVIVIVLLINLLPFIDASAVMTFTDRYTNNVYQLYPSETTPIQNVLSNILLLKNGPHQIQVLGLYVVLLPLAPLLLWMFSKGRVGMVLTLSWVLYIYNWAEPSRPTGAQFEYGFPLLTWQLLFVHGLAVGYFRNELVNWFQGYRRTLLLGVSWFLFFVFVFFTWNNPNPSLPDWYKLSFIPPDTFYELYSQYFRKNSLGVMRLLNYAVFLVVIYHVLTLFWKPIYKAIGWFLVPIGQASLYLFVLHVFMYIIVDSIPYYEDLIPVYGSGDIWLNTLAHSAVLGAMWLMVKHKVMFRWIPR